MESVSNTSNIHKYCENHQYMVELLDSNVNDIQHKLNCFENKAKSLFNHPTSVSLSYAAHLHNIRSCYPNFQFKIYEETQSSFFKSSTPLLNRDGITNTTRPVYSDAYTSPVLTCVTDLTDRIMTMDRVMSSCINTASLISEKLTRVKVFQLQPVIVQSVQSKVDNSKQYRTVNQSVPVVQYYLHQNPQKWTWHGYYGLKQHKNYTNNPTGYYLQGNHSQQNPPVVQSYQQQIYPIQFNLNHYLHQGSKIQPKQVGNHGNPLHSTNVSSQQCHSVTDINGYTKQRNPLPASSVYKSSFYTNSRTCMPELQQHNTPLSSDLINEMLMSSGGNLKREQDITSSDCSCCNSCILDMQVFCGCVVEKIKYLQTKTSIVCQDLIQIERFEKAKQLPQFDISSIKELQTIIYDVKSLQRVCLGLCSDIMFYSTMSENSSCNNPSSLQNAENSLCVSKRETMSSVMVEQTSSTTMSKIVSQTFVSKNGIVQETECPLDLTNSKADSTKDDTRRSKCNVKMKNNHTKSKEVSTQTKLYLRNKPGTIYANVLDELTVFCVKKNGSAEVSTQTKLHVSDKPATVSANVFNKSTVFCVKKNRSAEVSEQTKLHVRDKPATVSANVLDKSTVFCVKKNGSELHKAKTWFKKRNKSMTLKIVQVKKCDNVPESLSKTSNINKTENLLTESVLSDVAKVDKASVAKDVEASVAKVDKAIVAKVDIASVAKVVEANVAKNVEANVAKNVEANVAKNVEANVAKTVEANVAKNVEANVAKTVEANVAKINKANYNTVVVSNNKLKTSEQKEQSQIPTSLSSKFSTSTPCVSVKKGNSKWRKSFNCSTGKSKHSVKVKNVLNCTMPNDRVHKTSCRKSWVDLSPIKTVVKDYNEISVKSESESLFSWNLEESLYDMSCKKMSASNTARKNNKNEGKIFAKGILRTVLSVNRSTNQRGDRNPIYSKIVLPRLYNNVKINCTIGDLRDEEFKTCNHRHNHVTDSDVNDSDVMFTKSKRKLCFEDEVIGDSEAVDMVKNPSQSESITKKLKL